MRTKNIPAVGVTDLLGAVQENASRQNINSINSLVGSLKKGSFVLASLEKGEEIVHEGCILPETLRANENLWYGCVPLGIILSGEIVVLENGKGVRRLSAGDFLGLFETAFYLASGSERQLGRWTLVADSKITILFFGKSTLVGSEKSAKQFKTFLKNLAREDSVPKPITNLPLLDSIAGNVTTSLLNDCIIVAHTHILPSSVALIRHYAHLVGYSNLFILEKSYSTIKSAFNQVIQMGIDVVPVVMTKNAPYEFSLQRAAHALWNRVINTQKEQNISQIAVIDDGADLLLSIPWEKLQGVEIIGVEQTQRGISRIQNTSHKIPATVNVASSYVKKNVESVFIGKAIVEKMKDSGILNSSPVVGIIGTGAVGIAIKKELQKNNIDVLSYDIKLHTDTKQRKKRDVTSIDTLMNKSDVIIGSTGSDFFKGVALDKITGDKILVSASSSDIEFLSLLSLASFSENFNSVEVQIHQKLRVKIVNGGFPINFDREREWEASEDIQVTRALLYAGLIQALQLTVSKHKGKLYDLNDGAQKEIVDQWKSLKRE